MTSGDLHDVPDKFATLGPSYDDVLLLPGETARRRVALPRLRLAV